MKIVNYYCIIVEFLTRINPKAKDKSLFFKLFRLNIRNYEIFKIKLICSLCERVGIVWSGDLNDMLSINMPIK